MAKRETVVRGENVETDPPKPVGQENEGEVPVDKAKKPRVRSPKAADLPGMENRDIPELEELASEYVDIRDERIALNRRESELKKKLRAAMKQHNRVRYANDGVEIELIPPAGEDDVKVKVKKPKHVDDDGDDA